MKNVAFLEGLDSNFGEILATTLNCKRTAAAADDTASLQVVLVRLLLVV